MKEKLLKKLGRLGEFWKRSGKYLLILSVIVFTVVGCKTIPLKLTVPPPPVLRPVNVIDGIISGQDLENLIDNQTDIWEYINRLRALLGEKKFLKIIKSKEFKRFLNQQPQEVIEVFNEYKKTNFPSL